MRLLALAAFAAATMFAAPAVAGTRTESTQSLKARGCTVQPMNLPIGKLQTYGPIVRCPSAQAVAANACSTERYHTPSGKMSTVRRCAPLAQGGGIAAAD